MPARAVALSSSITTGRPSRAACQKVFGATKDINGQRPWLATVYGGKHNLTLSAGDYVVVVSCGGRKTEAPIAVKAGQRAEVTIGR